SEHYKIPYKLIFNKYHGKNIKQPGGYTIFSETEEMDILKCAAKCAEWGFPLPITDLHMFAKNLLDRQGRSVKKYINNLFGIDWPYSLLKRYQNSLKLCYKNANSKD